MPDTATAFNGIIVRTKATDSKAFVQHVTDALAKINSKPVGQQLLAGISAEIGKLKFGYLVCVMPKASVKNSFGPLIRWRTYEKGSVTLTSDENNACNGVGSVSGIRWDPKSTDTPDGARPPWVGLAHELIHCYHNLRGTSHLLGQGTMSTEDMKKLDEMRVVGLRGYEMEPICENRIRREHGIALRKSYHGRCSKAEGAPDKSLF